LFRTKGLLDSGNQGQSPIARNSTSYFGGDIDWAMSLREVTGRWQQNLRTLAGVDAGSTGLRKKGDEFHNLFWF